MSDLKVVLTTPPTYGGVTFAERFTTERGKGVPNFPLGYLMSYQKAYGDTSVDYKVIEARLEGLTPRQTLRRIERFDPDIVGMGLLTGIAEDCYRFAKLLKKNLDATVIGGNYHLTRFPEEGLENGFDIVTRGESEIQFTALIDAYTTGRNLSGIRGISYRNNGEIVHNEWQRPVENLDSIPFPDWEPCPTEFYLFSEGRGSMITTRHCPNNCRFCQPERERKRKYRPYRERSPGNVVDEMEWQIENFGVNEMFIADDNALANIKRVERICDEIKERRIDIGLYCGGRADAICRGGENFLRKLIDAGLRMLYMGVENREDWILKRYNKQETSEQIDKALKLCHKLDVPVLTSFIIGPYDDPFTVIKTMARCFKSMGVQVTIYQPLPDTIDFEERLRRGEKLSKNWSDYTLTTCITEDNRMSKRQIEILHKLAVISLNVNPYQLIRYPRQTFFKVKKTVSAIADRR